MYKIVLEKGLWFYFEQDWAKACKTHIWLNVFDVFWFRISITKTNLFCILNRIGWRFLIYTHTNAFDLFWFRISITKANLFFILSRIGWRRATPPTQSVRWRWRTFAKATPTPSGWRLSTRPGPDSPRNHRTPISPSTKTVSWTHFDSVYNYMIVFFLENTKTVSWTHFDSLYNYMIVFFFKTQQLLVQHILIGCDMIVFFLITKSVS